MMKNYSLAIIVSLLCLTVGFLIGKSTGNTGRYEFRDYKDAFMIFDTSTGIFYVKSGNGIIKRHTIKDYGIQQENKAKTKKNK